MLFLTDYTLPELEKWFVDNGMQKFRARQVWEWFYVRGADSYEKMTNLPKNVRALLLKKLPLIQTKVQEIKTAADDSEKRLIELCSDNDFVESVWIPMGSHATVCVSTQVGCPIGCSFCASGSEGFERNLTTGEIVEQVWHSSIAHSRRGIKNLVFMGMGEPFLNYKNLVKAIKILNNENGLKIGARRMTISTVGIVNRIVDFGKDVPQSNLAISLHATNDTLRKQLIPNCPSTIDDLISALSEYFKMTHRKITYEYVLLKDINDSLEHAVELVKIIKKVPSKINLIEYNKVDFNDYESPGRKAVKNFSNYLYRKGIDVAVRRKKGDDINAACGQLRKVSRTSQCDI